MKTIKLTPTEFYKFRKIAFIYGIAFTCIIANSIYTIKANEQQLETIGYV